jgi:hypothetical protein
MAIQYATKRKTVKSETPLSSPKIPGAAAPQDNLNEEIRKRAEEIYRRRNGGPGDELTDWLQAEKEVKQRNGIFSLS